LYSGERFRAIMALLLFIVYDIYVTNELIKIENKQHLVIIHSDTFDLFSRCLFYFIKLFQVSINLKILPQIEDRPS
jgi:hypothetical protein